MKITLQTNNPPACYKCDDLGYIAGTEVFGVARCDCAIWVSADMLAPGAITGSLRINAGPPEYVFAKGMLRISTDGMTYNGELIKDAGRAYRAFIATMEGRKPDEPLLERAYDLIDEARNAGQVLTIELVPLDPLAMGHYEMVADLRPKRERAEPIERDDLIDCAILHPDPAVEWDKALRGADEAYIDAVIYGLGAYIQNANDGSTEHVPAADMRPLQTMMHPDRRTEARKVIWPVPDPKNFTTERRDPHSTLTQEQFDKRSTDRKKREGR